MSKLNRKTLLGVDYGSKVTGLATFKPGIDPYPIPFSRLVNSGDDQLIDDIHKIVEEEAVDIIVIGLPLLLDGKESDTTKYVKKFSEKLTKKISSCIIYLQDETLTTYEAEERMKNSPQYNFKVDQTKIDSLSAAIILEDFFNSNLGEKG